MAKVANYSGVVLLTVLAALLLAMRLVVADRLRIGLVAACAGLGGDGV
ncbi:hypothetical protein P9273_25235 [Mesorhizobium sp. WSM4935]|nr:hypothetical protein [Mesorhizobium sp. WSM4935]MDG4878384.1 hypothetical protein [Mesorhizobium sp. WSM4935]